MRPSTHLRSCLRNLAARMPLKEIWKRISPVLESWDSFWPDGRPTGSDPVRVNFRIARHSGAKPFNFQNAVSGPQGHKSDMATTRQLAFERSRDTGLGIFGYAVSTAVIGNCATSS